MNRAERRKRKLPNEPRLPEVTKRDATTATSEWLRKNHREISKSRTRKIDGITEHQLSDGRDGLFQTERTVADLKSWFVKVLCVVNYDPDDLTPFARSTVYHAIMSWLDRTANPWWIKRAPFLSINELTFVLIFSDEADAVEFYMTWHGTDGVRVNADCDLHRYELRV